MSRSAAQETRVQENYTYGRYQGVLTNASAKLVEAPASGLVMIDSIIVTEKSGNARTFTLRHVGSGEADDNTADIFQAAPLASLETQILEGASGKPLLTLLNGDVLKGLASANTAVNILVNYRTQI